MIKIFKSLLLALIISGISISCVPLNQFKELETKNNSCKSENTDVKTSNEKLIVDTTEMGAEIRALSAKFQKIASDTSNLSANVRKYKRLYENALYTNNELIDNQSKLIEGNTEEVKKMLAQLQAAQEDLQKREDELQKLEQAINDKKANNEKLQADLEKNNKILNEKSKRLIELENMLSAKDSAVNALRDKVASALNQFEKDGLTIQKRNGKVYVSLEEKLLFKSGRWNVDPKGQKAIEQLAVVLEQNPDINIMIEGHTDDVRFNGKGDIKDNWDLSVKRATSIVKIILAKSKISPTRLTVSGKGEFMPIDPAKTVEARRKNRRTEIILTPKLDELFKLLENN
ncbi:MAG: OmpA family protein [Bacteroidetes bacterium]|jgi:chemotaxis protein MotB|nr:OmpA family protein [Bacteroidota bacterium]MBT6685128.1 OmpA family protein [Bacteroidota bacterium]MBT7142039.1 OmpA family protein [Bacteroidota bacterium]MBT7493361.1 OmpA family protein [Bacteroidota bacterium]